MTPKELETLRAKGAAWDGVIAFLVDHPDGHGLLHWIDGLDRQMDPDDPTGKKPSPDDESNRSGTS